MIARRSLCALGVASLLGLSACGGSGDDVNLATPVDATIVVVDSVTNSGIPTVATGYLFGSGECPPEQVDEPVRAFTEAPRLCIDPANSYVATFVTSEGDIVVELDAANLPGTVNNFVTLARYHYYDDTPIFRIESTADLFQGGGQDNASSPGYTINYEGGRFTYPPGTLAMARADDLNSGGAQWFFTTGDKASYLGDEGTYVAFGHIVDGLDVAVTINTFGGEGGKPTKDIRLERVLISENGAGSTATGPADSGPVGTGGAGTAPAGSGG